MKKLWELIVFSKSLWRLYVSIALFTIVISVLNLVRPIFVGKVIDQIIKSLNKGGSMPLRTLVIFGLVIFAADLLINILGNIGGYIGDRMAVRLKKLLSEKYYEKLMTLPQNYYDNELSGTIVNRLTRTIDNVTRFMQMMSNNFVSMFLTIFISIGYMFKYSWQVGALILALIPLYFLLTRKTSSKWQEYEKEINGHMDQASGRFTETISQIKVVKSFLQEDRELKFFGKQYSSSLKITKKQSILWHREDSKRKFILNVVFFIAYVVLIVQAAHGELSAGNFSTIVLMINTVSFPITNMSFIIENAQRAIAGSREYFKIMAIKPSISDDPGAPKLNIKNAGIKFDNVSFAYDKKLVLKNVSFEVKEGTKVALVGESGEGKTTITNLLMRMYEPQSGTIMIDNQLINIVSQSSLRGSIGVVFQDPSLFSGTIRENIGYSKHGASEVEIIAAAKAANAHEFIKKLDDGYGSTIGERGVKLSGGQKQRIAIARAILKNPPILILDEATSSLDSRSEHEVQEALETLMQGRTTVIVAHRLSTIAGVDTIVTIKNGKVDEIGSPKDLAKTNGIYAQLLKLQSGDFEQNKESLKKFEIAA